MTDVKQIAHRYIELWNERAPSRRREMLAANWTADAKYIDPLMAGDGHDGEQTEDEATPQGHRRPGGRDPGDHSESPALGGRMT